jgi:Winged helix DNA-binding domain
MKPEEIVHRRMYGQHLWGTPLKNPQTVVRRLAALQSQEFHFAKWSVAQRAKGVTEAAMDKAFADGTILRTHLLRPTWHFVLPEDIRWMLKLTAPRVNAVVAHYYRKLELDEKLFTKVNSTFANVLEGGRHLTRKELGAVLERSGIAVDSSRLGFMMMRAELDGVVCSGALRGKQHTYALLDERAPKAKELDRDEALAELTRRYFTARGPATLKDYLRWSSLTAAEGKAAIDMVKSELDRDEVDGRTYWFEPSQRPERTSSTRIDLVQGYDECIMSYSESRDVLASTAPGEGPVDQSPFIHAVLLNGRLLGHWRHASRTKYVIVETFLYRPLNRVEMKALEAAVDRYAEFKGVPITITEAH